MPQPFTHYISAMSAMKSLPDQARGREFWDKYKNFITFGTFSPDLFYTKNLSLVAKYIMPHAPAFIKFIPVSWVPNTFTLIDSVLAFSSWLMIPVKSIYWFVLRKVFKKKKEYEWSLIAERTHNHHSFNSFICMINTAKQSKVEKNLDSEKQLAFGMGFYAHVITDAIYHPLIYRNAKDHWNTKEFDPEKLHKWLELQIDRWLSNYTFGVEPDASKISWQCSGDQETTLDSSIRQLLESCLMSHYRGAVSPEFHASDIDDAYANYYKYVAGLAYSGKYVTHWGRGAIVYGEGITPNSVGDLFLQKYRLKLELDNDVIDASVFDLANITKNCLNQTFEAVFAFWDSTKTDARSFFIEHYPQLRYLHEDWNLDTGLPAYLNEESIIQDGRGELHYKAFADVLIENYRRFAPTQQ